VIVVPAALGQQGRSALDGRSEDAAELNLVVTVDRGDPVRGHSTEARVTMALAVAQSVRPGLCAGAWALWADRRGMTGRMPSDTVRQCQLTEY
jgi:hypothetical protein